MSSIRLLTKLTGLALLFSVQGFAQYYAQKAITKAECHPLELTFDQVKEVIQRVQNKKVFLPIQALDLHEQMRTFEKLKAFREPPIAKIDEESEAVKLVRNAFNRTQALLFGEQKPFRLSFCEHCDLHPRIEDDLVIYVDLGFIENLIKTQDKNLVDLDLAHAFSHYVLEVYLAEEKLSPGGSVTRYLSWLRESFAKRSFTADDNIMADAKYHAEVDAVAAGILVMLNKRVPDFAPIVDSYRINRFKNNRRRPITPYEIYIDQEVRVNTLKWIIQTWTPPSSGS